MSALAMSSVSAFGAVAAAPQTRRDQRRPTPAVHVVRGGAPRATTSGSRQADLAGAPAQRAARPRQQAEEGAADAARKMDTATEMLHVGMDVLQQSGREVT